MRTIAKTTSYSLMHMAVAFGVAYVMTGSVRIAASISVVEPIVQTFFYALHEHLWSKKSPIIGHAEAQYVRS